jgi:precorrin-2 dehydrogenase/sirohydrochlorin ferrochelatase
VFLDLRDKPCVVVGGGKVAERKALSLLRAGARLKVISPRLTARLEREKARGAFRHVKRSYRKGDLRGAFLAIAATDDMEENSGIAKEKGLLLNVVDRPELCNFIVPSTVKRGPLTIAVSTSGASPAMARAIRKDLESLYGREFGPYLEGLRRKRVKAASGIKDPGERGQYLKSLASEKVVRDLRKGRKP